MGARQAPGCLRRAGDAQCLPRLSAQDVAITAWAFAKLRTLDTAKRPQIYALGRPLGCRHTGMLFFSWTFTKASQIFFPKKGPPKKKVTQDGKLFLIWAAGDP